MAREILDQTSVDDISAGAADNDGTGTPARTAATRLKSWAAKANRNFEELYAGGGSALAASASSVAPGDQLPVLAAFEPVTFSPSVGGAGSGTITAPIANGTYSAQFSNGEFRTVTVASGTSVSWSPDLAAGTVTTATLWQLRRASARQIAESVFSSPFNGTEYTGGASPTALQSITTQAADWSSNAVARLVAAGQFKLPNAGSFATGEVVLRIGGGTVIDLGDYFTAINTAGVSSGEWSADVDVRRTAAGAMAAIGSITLWDGSAAPQSYPLGGAPSSTTLTGSPVVDVLANFTAVAGKSARCAGMTLRIGTPRG